MSFIADSPKFNSESKADHSTPIFFWQFRDLRNNLLSGAFPAGMCNRTYSNGCLIGSNRFTTSCSGCNFFAPATTSLELQALKDFFNSTNGGSWINSTNWLIGDPCINGWYGVTCDNYFAVVTLDLTNNNVIGSLSASIGNLINLTKLALSGNGITGSIPSSITSMNNLANLTLSGNQLNGTIPSVPGSISYL